MRNHFVHRYPGSNSHGGLGSAYELSDSEDEVGI